MNPYKLIMYKYLMCNDNPTMFNTKKFSRMLSILKYLVGWGRRIK